MSAKHFIFILQRNVLQFIRFCQLQITQKTTRILMLVENAIAIVCRHSRFDVLHPFVRVGTIYTQPRVLFLFLFLLFLLCLLLASNIDSIHEGQRFAAAILAINLNVRAEHTRITQNIAQVQQMRTHCKNGQMVGAPQSPFEVCIIASVAFGQHIRVQHGQFGTIIECVPQQVMMCSILRRYFVDEIAECIVDQSILATRRRRLAFQ
mmetsp:Transcript_6280/g.9962  ORF Transcript_6280/g.9962 Transcript_6280/m.9962 type:complete len:207 (-) Transcript_6280:108-728(-)